MKSRNIKTSLNTFAQKTNVNTKNRIIAYDIRELGEQLMPLGMLVTLDSIFNRVIQNWKKGKTTWIFADEFYLLFRYQYTIEGNSGDAVRERNYAINSDSIMGYGMVVY